MPQLECISWTQFKQIVITNKDLSLQYTSDSQGYDIYGPDLDEIIWHIRLLNNGDSDVTDFLTNFAPNANQSIRLASEVIFPTDTYTTTTTLASIRPTYGNLDTRMISNLTINIQNTGSAAASISILGSLDNINYIVSLLSAQSLSAGSGLHFQNSESFQSISLLAQIPSLGSATTLTSSAYGII